MSDTFLKTLQSVVVGARHAEEFCHVVVSSAVEDVLLCVARDFGHDYGGLLKKYKHDVVRRHASGLAVNSSGLCKGETKSGKACGRRAVLHGYCQKHGVQAAEEEAKRRKVQAYAAAVPARTSDKKLVELLCGRFFVTSDKYRVGGAGGKNGGESGVRREA